MSQFAALPTVLPSPAARSRRSPGSPSSRRTDRQANIFVVFASLVIFVVTSRLAGKESVRRRFTVWGYGWTHGVDKVFRQDRPFRGEIGGAGWFNILHVPSP